MKIKGCKMRIWIDLANSPHVSFFRAIIPELERKGCEVEITSRDFGQTIEMANAAHLSHVAIGRHGGRALSAKAGNLVGRAAALAKWGFGRRFHLAISHNSYAQTAAAQALGIKSVTLMDYEHQPANHVAFRLASRIIVPVTFPAAALRRYGAGTRKVRRYDGTKEDVYLADFEPDPDFAHTLRKLGVEPADIIVIVRPPARDALYHRFENQLFDALLKHVSTRANVRIILLARTEAQRSDFSKRAGPNWILPTSALDGANLLAAADLVISGGGTMNREAAALGVPAATIYAGRWGAVDAALVGEGRLSRITRIEDIENLPIRKKAEAIPRRARHVREQVVNFLLEPFL